MLAVALVLITTTVLIVHQTHTTTIVTTAHAIPIKAVAKDMTLPTAQEATIATHRHQATLTILAHAAVRIALMMAIHPTLADELAVVHIHREALAQVLIRQVLAVAPPVVMENQATAVAANARRTTTILAIIQTIIAGTTATAVVRVAGATTERLAVAVAGAAVAHLVAAHPQAAVAQAVRQVRVHAVHANH